MHERTIAIMYIAAGLVLTALAASAVYGRTLFERLP